MVFVARSCLTLATPWTVASSVHGIFQIRILAWVASSFSRGIFPTQESNRGLLHCSQRERASERWRRWECPEVRRAGRGAWRPGTGSRAVDDRQTGSGPAPPEPCTATLCSLRDAPEAPRCAAANPGQ